MSEKSSLKEASRFEKFLLNRAVIISFIPWVGGGISAIMNRIATNMMEKRIRESLGSNAIAVAAHITRVGSISWSRGIACVTKTGTGQYTVTLLSEMPDTNYVVLAIPNGTPPIGIQYGTKKRNEFSIEFRNNVYATDTDFFVVVFAK